MVYLHIKKTQNRAIRLVVGQMSVCHIIGDRHDGACGLSQVFPQTLPSAQKNKERNALPRGRKTKGEKNMTQGTLLGFRKFNSKKGLPLCTVEIAYPYYADEYNSGNAIGNRSISAFVPRTFNADTLTEKSIGKTFNIETAFYNGQNNLVYMQEA